MSTTPPSKPPPGFSGPPQQQQSPPYGDNDDEGKGKQRVLPRNLALSNYDPQAVPVRPHDMSIPLSSLTAYQLRPPARLSRAWRPNCHHSVMSTLYQVSERFKCDNCKRSHPFGWLYRCVMDREPLIIGIKELGFQIAFDQLGHNFSQQMTLGKHGADARSEKYSFLDEITREQLWNYTPEELKEILAQRDHVLDVITNERLRDQDFNNQYGFKYPDDDRPWMPDPKYECQHKVCHRCHPIGRQKSWVSLDGVLNGDIPPTVATGYSFSQVKIRPCVDVETVKNLGCRPVPLPRDHKAHAPVASSSSSVSPNEITDDHVITESTGMVYDQDTGDPIASISTFGHPVLASPPTTAEPVFSVDLDGLWTRITAPGYTTSVKDDETESETDLSSSFEHAEHNKSDAEEANGMDIFGSEPLEVIEGVALTEEAVEFGTADIVVSTTANGVADTTGLTTPTLGVPRGLSPSSGMSNEQ
ncbi:uncharacterized protein QC763_711400 [Podospora pseudopauciseta]|uniref:Uncharacterized protein n=1 Tax=Podospora pseudopauciseta TaxID=2093780 RepID=A0ABR0H2Q9_9PEZI|nr:hypothetical protein QC763_711400 [Podospora pseudopauciseta]